MVNFAEQVPSAISDGLVAYRVLASSERGSLTNALCPLAKLV